MKHRLLTGLLAGAAALALTVTATPAQAAPPWHAPSPTTYAAVGDSFAAGWGAGDGSTFFMYSYPVLLAGGNQTNLQFLAVPVGVTTESVLTQVEGIAETTKQVTLTVGGNDLDFVGTVAACLESEAACQAALGLALSKLGDVRKGLDTVIAAIHAQAPDATIYVTGYPLLFQATGDACVAGDVGQPLLAPAVVTNQLDAATVTLNRTIKSATTGKVAKFTKYVDVTDPFLGHGLCGAVASLDPTTWLPNPATWINPIVVTPAPITWLHPTAEGQRAYAMAVMGKGFRTTR